jgi:hypothetical protein
VMPVSLWNVALVKQTLALDSQNGRLIPLSVIDLGEERLILKGHPMLAHHYSIKSSLAEDIWYDQRDRLVKVELRVDAFR